MLFPPESEPDAARWAATAAGHAFVGMICAVLCLWGGAPVWIGPLGYAIFWEGVIQRFGAGLADAITDAAFVALGACCAWALWGQDMLTAGASALAALVGIGIGVWRRM